VRLTEVLTAYHCCGTVLAALSAVLTVSTLQAGKKIKRNLLANLVWNSLNGGRLCETHTEGPGLKSHHVANGFLLCDNA